MSVIKKWIHGTEVHFTEWKLPLGKPAHKGGAEAHSAIFFTTSKEYALGSANGSGGICTAELIEGSNVLNMNSCNASESEEYRLQCSKKKLGSKSPQITVPFYWAQGWETGSIMKYAASTQDEAEMIQRKVNLASNAKHTKQGAAAFNELQLLTRNVIEELVISAKELGYDAVIGNEIDTLHPSGQKTYEIMFVLNHESISSPTWLSIPK